MASIIGRRRRALQVSIPAAASSGHLGQFAATTSLQLKNVLTDETGSGAAVFGTNPTLTGPKGTSLVSSKSSNYPVTAGDSGTTFVATAGDPLVFSLPAATVGLNYRFVIGGADAVELDPNGVETITDSAGTMGGAGAAVGSSNGAACYIECVVAGKWHIAGFSGTWAAP